MMKTVQTQALVEHRALINPPEFNLIMKRVKAELLHKAVDQIIEELGDKLYEFADSPRGRTVVRVRIMYEADPRYF